MPLLSYIAMQQVAEILLVEDNPGDVALTRKAFGKARYPVRLTVVEDGEEALRRLRRESRCEDWITPDLVLLDLNLPGLNGREVLSAIKDDPQLCQVPVIVFSGSRDQADIAESYRRNANCYVVKPSQFRDLVALISSLADFWLLHAKLPDVTAAETRK